MCGGLMGGDSRVMSSVMLGGAGVGVGGSHDDRRDKKKCDDYLSLYSLHDGTGSVLGGGHVGGGGGGGAAGGGAIHVPRSLSLSDNSGRLIDWSID